MTAPVATDITITIPVERRHLRSWLCGGEAEALAEPTLDEALKAFEITAGTPPHFQEALSSRSPCQIGDARQSRSILHIDNK